MVRVDHDERRVDCVVVAGGRGHHCPIVLGVDELKLADLTDVGDRDSPTHNLTGWVVSYTQVWWWW